MLSSSVHQVIEVGAFRQIRMESRNRTVLAFELHAEWIGYEHDPTMLVVLRVVDGDV